NRDLPLLGVAAPPGRANRRRARQRVPQIAPYIQTKTGPGAQEPLTIFAALTLAGGDQGGIGTVIGNVLRSRRDRLMDVRIEAEANYRNRFGARRPKLRRLPLP